MPAKRRIGAHLGRVARRPVSHRPITQGFGHPRAQLAPSAVPSTVLRGPLSTCSGVSPSSGPPDDRAPKQAPLPRPPAPPFPPPLPRLQRVRPRPGAGGLPLAAPRVDRVLLPLRAGDVRGGGRLPSSKWAPPPRRRGSRLAALRKAGKPALRAQAARIPCWPHRCEGPASRPQHPWPGVARRPSPHPYHTHQPTHPSIPPPPHTHTHACARPLQEFLEYFGTSVEQETAVAVGLATLPGSTGCCLQDGHRILPHAPRPARVPPLLSILPEARFSRLSVRCQLHQAAPA